VKKEATDGKISIVFLMVPQKNTVVFSSDKRADEY
jgi:hypothetical protein